jgi:hypothetical protein
MAIKYLCPPFGPEGMQQMHQWLALGQLPSLEGKVTRIIAKTIPLNLLAS